MNGFSFKLLEQYLNNANLNIVIAKNGVGLSVSVLPQSNCKDKAFNTLKPIILNGTAEELDAEFHKIIQRPLERVSGVLSNVASFEESTDKAASETKAAKEIQEKVKKDKEKAEKKVEKAKEYLESKDFDKAMFTINEALNLSSKLASAGKLKTEIENAKSADGQVDLFVAIEEEESKVLPANSIQEVDPNSGDNIGEPVIVKVEEPNSDEEDERYAMEAAIEADEHEQMARAMHQSEDGYNYNEPINFK